MDRAPATEQLSLVVALFMEHETELARQVVMLRPPTDKQPALAAIVGACLIVDHVPQSDPRWNLVRSLIAETPATQRGVEYMAAKHLIGDADESSVAAAATTSADRTTAAFFIALGEAASGRYDDALTDLLVAGEGPGNYVTSSFAISQLYTWRAKLRPWESIVRERLL